MASVLVETAEAVVTALNEAAEGTFSQNFVAERSYADWELPLEDAAPADQVLVDVVPVPQCDSELEDRGHVVYKPGVDIIVRKRITPNNRDGDSRIELAELDALEAFIVQLSNYFTTDRFADLADAIWDGTELRRRFVPEHLRRLHQFTGIVRLTFNVSVALA